MPKNIAIILSAGKGSRLKSNIPKQYIEVNNKPLIYYTIETFEKSVNIDEILIVSDKEHIDFFKNEFIPKYNFKKIKEVISGGKERSFSVKNALDTLILKENTKDDIILIHDGARPFISEDIISSGIKEAKIFGAVVVGVKVKDTIKVVENKNIILDTPNRESLWIAQTPQIFKLELIKNAYENLSNYDTAPTDDSILVENIGHKVTMVQGSYENFKITTQDDLALANFLLNIL